MQPQTGDISVVLASPERMILPENLANQSFGGRIVSSSAVRRFPPQMKCAEDRPLDVVGQAGED